MKNVLILLFLFALLLLFALPFTSLESKEPKLYEMPGTQVVPIQDTEAGRQYELYIKLPEKYSENESTEYPVIYFTDAVWHIEILSATTAFLMENAILVGISWQTDIKDSLRKEEGAHASRYRDYSIRKSSKPDIQAKYQMGQANSHLNFIRNDVIKYVEKNYRTAPGNRTYFGYSLGGLFGAYILLAQPDTFKNYILGSPSLWNDIPTLSELGPDLTSKSNGLNANVFISYGTLETELGERIEEFITMLNDRNDKSLLLKREVILGSHQTAFPATGVQAVTWLSSLKKQGEK